MAAGAMGCVALGDDLRELALGLECLLAGEPFSSRSLAAGLMKSLGLKPAGPVESMLEQLSSRELEVFSQMGTGATTAVVARQLGLSVKTVETYQARLKEKLGLASGEALRQLAARLGSRP
jgi:DNA-binding NarL/FixJ family response regulator